MRYGRPRARAARRAARGRARRASSRRELEQRVARVEPVEAQLRLHGVAIGGERVALDQDLEAALGRAEEAHEHQMQVHGERVHRDDFVRLRADELRERSAEAFVIVEPTGLRTRECAARARRVRRVCEVALDAELRPALELGGDAARYLARHEPERVAAKVRERSAAVLRQREASAERAQLVGCVERAGGRRAAAEVARAHPAISAASRCRSGCRFAPTRSRRSARTRAAGLSRCPRRAGTPRAACSRSAGRTT